MISECPNCNQTLQFSDVHKQKLSTAIDKLTPGRTLKFGCPKCKKPIEIASDGFPVSKPGKTPQTKAAAKQTPKVRIEPPRPENIDWLTSGEIKEDQIVDNVPYAMVLMPDGEIKKAVSQGLEGHKYQLYCPKTVDEAVNSMRFRDFAVVAYYSEYETTPLKTQDFHKYMMQMSMSKRRSIYYILVGPSFQTLYDLEALTHSANLVVNTNEATHFLAILKKSLTDYETLFKPYRSMIKKHGKS
jgi:hypothetical protein